MAHSGEPPQIPLELPSGGASSSSGPAVGSADPRVPLLNLSTVRMRMDSVQQFLSQSLNSNTLLSGEQMDLVSSEIVSAIHQIIVNGAALLSCSQQAPENPGSKPAAVAAAAAAVEESGDRKLPVKSPIGRPPTGDLKVEEGVLTTMKDEKDELVGDCEIVELDSVELLAEHTHFCDICGKGFKRDANLRMHMRAHGNQFKTPEALARPDSQCPEPSPSTKRSRFSCPFEGCNRNKAHKKFRPLKSVVCVKNHFKRSHCPKMYSCNRCNKKSFSVLADLRSHMKHCGEAKWKCSCGASFSRKDKLFGHMALFEGHMPAVADDDDKRNEATAVEEEEDEDMLLKDEELTRNSLDDGIFKRLLDGFGSVDFYCLRDILSPANELGSGNGISMFSDT
ncbi:protein SENSITIVE TO PROTON RHIZOTOXICITY 1-like [Punica granatum]|uniref:Protein SENSITIVE TO PROTON RHIZOTOXICITY 1-like n=1 Tax=Punica granatum TaxID=22663 RepID=A0A218XBQ4_PUNGR|nr:protein SENSITIVE TO PROTON RHIZOTOXICITY 1-like [Punica granatum]OWM82218.1 hypothetical protein CDL15_Pgr001792 [Punica granatum]